MSLAVDDWKIERLGFSHERDHFSCGKPSLDDFIRRLVTQYEKRNLGRTYVATRPGQMTVCGYFTLASGALALQHLPAPSAKKLPKHPVPAVLLARLAVDQGQKGHGLGEAMHGTALVHSLALADKVGVHAVEVHAIDREAKGFYEKYGFIPLLDDELHLFLPIASIRAALPPMPP